MVAHLKLIPLFFLTFTIANARPALFIVLEGFTGCNRTTEDSRSFLISNKANDVQNYFFDEIKKAGVEPTIVFGCFGPDSTLDARDVVPDLRFQVRGEKKSEIISEPFDGFFPHSIIRYTSTNSLPPQVFNFFKTVSDVYNQMKDAPTYVIGHSYGGWLAMLLTEQQIVAPHALFTMDAISPVYCNPHNAVKLINIPKGCLEAPPEFDSEKIKKIRNQTHIWVNRFQKRFRHVQSGPIDTAENFNVKTPRQFRNISPLKNEHHINVWRDLNAWDDLKHIVLGEQR